MLVEAVFDWFELAPDGLVWPNVESAVVAAVAALLTEPLALNEPEEVLLLDGEVVLP